jgi:hypothetical protein
MSDLLLQVVLFIPVLLVNGWLAIRIDHWNSKRREKQFLKRVQLKYPNASITFTAIETSDSDAMRRLREQLEES